MNKTLRSLLKPALLLLLAAAAVLYARSRPKLIALTFDDGPSPCTEALLDGLAERGVPATFFMTGENGEGGRCGVNNGNQALLDRMWAEGHQLANHTYRHLRLKELSAAEITAEVSGVEDAIFQAVGGRFRCMVRTPEGQTGEIISDTVSAPIILWTADSLDWKYRDADFVAEGIPACAESGCIVLAHDLYETTVEGVLRAVDALEDQGYTFVTVAELLRRTGVDPADGQIYQEGGRGLLIRPAYDAPKLKASEDREAGGTAFTCSAAKGLAVHYTTDESYPKLSDPILEGSVTLEAGTVLTAVGVDDWGTRTPAAVLTAGDSGS